MTHPSRGLQPRVEFVASGPIHPRIRWALTDSMLVKAVHTFAVLTGEPCGCGGALARPAAPATRAGPGDHRRAPGSS